MVPQWIGPKPHKFKGRFLVLSRWRRPSARRRFLRLTGLSEGIGERPVSSVKLVPLAIATSGTV